jgi:hypothetical protein
MANLLYKMMVLKCKKDLEGERERGPDTWLRYTTFFTYKHKHERYTVRFQFYLLQCCHSISFNAVNSNCSVDFKSLPGLNYKW